MQPFIFFGNTCCSDNSKILIIIQPFKRMSRFKRFMAIAIAMNRVYIQILYFGFLKHLHIHGFFRLITQHCFNL